jgi:lactoylglutathione lyase
VALLAPAFRITNLDRTLRFYVDGLGMAKLTQMGTANQRETILGFASNPRQPGIILLEDKTIANPPALIMGNGYKQLAMRVSGLPEVVARLRQLGFAVSDVRAVAMGHTIALATDPDGYKLELVESSAKQEH